MGELVTFASNGNDASGYLALPDGGTGPGVIVVQEWWGLDSGIKEMSDRLAAAGLVALAHDLFHGELAGHTEMVKAGELMSALPPDRAGRDMSGAVDFLADHDATTGDEIGVMNAVEAASATIMAKGYGEAPKSPAMASAEPHWPAPVSVEMLWMPSCLL